MSKTAAQGPTYQHPSNKKKRSAPIYSDTRPLRGKVFFLDLPGYKHQEAIEQKLVLRGATVDKFFHRGVKYLVTSRKQTGKKGDSAVAHSQGSRESGAGGDQLGVPSPSSDSSKSKSVPVAFRTRAAKMLAASLEKQGPKSNEADLLKVARSFGTKVVSLEELLKELRKFKSLPISKENENAKERKQYKVTKLKNVFMKIEDNSGAYRPLIYETETWPLPLANCACPYDPPRGSDRPRVAQPSRATGARLTQELPASLPAASAPTAGPTAAAAVVKKRPGYCECCALRYEDLKMHLKSKKHMEYASNPANFAALDALVGQGEYSFPAFLERLKQKRNHGIAEDTVLLLTPPSSPKTTPAPIIEEKVSMIRKTESPAAADWKQITLVTTNFSSPRRGSLRLTPIRSLAKELQQGSSSKPTKLAISSHDASAPHSPSLASPCQMILRNNFCSTPSPKRLKHDDLSGISPLPQLANTPQKCTSPHKSPRKRASPYKIMSPRRMPFPRKAASPHVKASPRKCSSPSSIQGRKRQVTVTDGPEDVN